MVQVDLISSKARKISWMTNLATGVLSSKASLHLYFHMNQQINIQRIHLFWSSNLLHVLDAAILLSHVLIGSLVGPSRVIPSTPSQILLVHPQSVVICPAVSTSLQVGHTGVVGMPLRAKFDLTANEFVASFHMYVCTFAHRLLFQIVCHIRDEVDACWWIPVERSLLLFIE